MAHTIEKLALMQSSPGAERYVKVHRFGERGARPLLYVQAALHANETPGLLITHHLIAALQAADQRNQIVGEVVVVPFANPIGLSENILGQQIGREALDGNGNFNRGFPDLSPALITAVADKLTQDPAENTRIVRNELKTLVAAIQPVNEFKSLQKTLMSLAIDADFVLDIHTELEACVCMVVAPWTTPSISDLIAEINPQLVHETDTPALFDTICSRPWFDLSEHVAGRFPVEQACVGSTLEMRGVTDVDDETASADAAAMLRFMRGRGMLTDFPQAPAQWLGVITAHKDVEFVRTPVAGVVAYKYPVGAAVAAGTLIAEIVNPDADDVTKARTPIYAAKGGLLYGRTLNRLVRPFDCVAKLAAGLGALEEAGQ
jgi:predicted deacylase